MLNTNPLNTNELNSDEATMLLGEIGEEIYTSFGSEHTTEYGYVSQYGAIFNFSNITCTCHGESQKYGNILLEHNFHDLPSKEISEYASPMRHGGIINRIRFNRFDFTLKLQIIAPDYEALQTELQSIKTHFNTGGKLYRKEFNRESYIPVEEVTLEVGTLLLSGTEIDLTFTSVSPFWIDKNGTTEFFEDNTTNINGTLLVNESQKAPYISTLIHFKNVTGVIDKVIVTLDGYPLEVENIMETGKVLNLVAEKKNGRNIRKAIYDGDELNYKGQFVPFPINTPKPFSVELFGSGSAEYSVYFIYDNIVL